MCDEAKPLAVPDPLGETVEQFLKLPYEEQITHLKAYGIKTESITIGQVVQIIQAACQLGKAICPLFGS